MSPLVVVQVGLYVHAVMQNTDNLHAFRGFTIENQMPPDMERPVPRRQLTRAMPQRWIVLKRHQSSIEQRGVAVVLLFAPRAERHAQNILVIGLRLIRDNERVIRGGHRGSGGGRVLVCHGHSA